MLVEVVLVGSSDMTKFLSIVPFLLMIRFLQFNVVKTIAELQSQLQRFRAMPMANQGFIRALSKKILVMKMFLFVMAFYFMNKVFWILLRVYVAPFYQFVFSQSVQLITIFLITIIFRPQAPEEIRLVVGPEGRMIVAQEMATVSAKKSNSVQMVAFS
jgi:hypothetical protein